MITPVFVKNNKINLRNIIICDSTEKMILHKLPKIEMRKILEILTKLSLAQGHNRGAPFKKMCLKFQVNFVGIQNFRKQ